MRTRETNQLLMAQWLQAWTTLGKWQALNARLSRELSPSEFTWSRRSSPGSRLRVTPTAVSARAG